MSLGHGAKIVTDSLVFYYDTHNTVKSWKGKPTINLNPDIGLNGMSGVTVTYIGTEDGWKKYALGGAWTDGNTYPYSMSISSVPVLGGITYSSGIYIKTNVPEKFDYLFTGMNYVNQPQNKGGTSFSIPQKDGSIFVGRYGFEYVDNTTQSGYLMSRGISVGGVTYNPATDFVWIKNGQIEAGNFCTPYVSGTRSDTNSLLDMMGNCTITMTNITYNIDNTFSFNGIDNRAIMENPQMPQYNWSIEIVTSYNDTSNLPILVNPYSYGVDQYIKYHSDGRVMLALTELADTNNRTHYSTYYASPGENVHYVFIRTNTSVLIYVNGELNREISDTIISAPWDLTWCIGARHNSTYWYNGEIPILKVYNRVLTSQEVKQNFNAIRGRFGI